MKHYETELPAGYREAYTIDAANKKTGVTLNLVAAVIMVAAMIPAILIIRPGNILEGFSFSRYLITFGGLLVYLVLHELVHGAAYKLLTRQKLTFEQLQIYYQSRGLMLHDRFEETLDLLTEDGKYNYIAYLLAD